VVVTLVAVEVWMSSWWNGQGHVGSGRGSRAPIDCAWSHLSHQWERVPQLGVPVAHRLARRSHVSLERGESRPRGSGALMMPRGLGRGREMLPKVPISPGTSPQGSSEMKFVIHAASN
jgi:hypothetical protein